MTDPQKNQPVASPAQPVPAPSSMPPAGTGPWWVKMPTGARPPQGEIVIDRDHVINRQGKDFVLFVGLLDAAHKAGLQSIHTNIVQCPSSLNAETAIVHATVEFPWGSFTGLGDANPENTSRNIAPHRIRMAETRAKARALRDALNVGMVAMEEMGPEPGDAPASGGQQNRQDGVGTTAPRPVSRPDGTTSTTSSPGTRKSYGTPITKGPVQGGSSSRWPSGE